MKCFTKTLLVGAAVFLTAHGAHAMATLRISANAGVNWLKIRDVDGDGNVAFSGTIGQSWSIAIAASSAPATGPATDPVMRLSASSLVTTAPGTLLVEFSDVFFGPIPSGNLFNTSLSSDNVGLGKTTVWSFMGAANTLFDETQTLLGFEVEKGPAQFAIVSSDPITGNAQFSLTMRVAIRHSGADSTTFDAVLSDPPPSVPEGGSTLVLLGLVVVGLASVGFKRSRTV